MIGKSHTEHKVKSSSLWEYNLDAFDWHDTRAIIVKKVRRRIGTFYLVRSPPIIFIFF